ncbi:hypothetical protein DOY81_009567 [Sarcophaga bullata]|nr:hypothetical protein DOY81_009567 [Sarcophaga bullata]
MSLLQEEFESNSQHDFAEVLDDDETTTSGVLEAFEISSSNLMPTTNEDVTSEPVAVVDDSSSTDAIQIIKVSDSSSTESAASNNAFFNSSEIFVINDDDDDDDDDDVDELEDGIGLNDVDVDDDEDDDIEEIVQNNNIIHDDDDEDNEDRDDEDCDVNITTNKCSKRTLQNAISLQDSSSNSQQPQNNGVIVSANGTMILLETPNVEEQQHHHHHLHHSQITNSSKCGTSHNDYVNDANVKPKRLSDEFSKNPENANETPTSSAAASSKLLHEPNNMIYDLTESQPLCSDTQAHERMSSRLKKMNLNHSNSLSNNCTNSQDLPTSSSSSGHTKSSALLMSDIISDIDLLERRDFENEQRLTGGTILKSSSLIKNNMLDLGLVKSQQQLNLKINCNTRNGEEQPSISVPIRICQQRPRVVPQLSSSSSASSSSSSSSSTVTPANSTGLASSTTTNNLTTVIVEAASAQNSEIYSNSNSNDSLTSRPSSTCLTSNRRQLLTLGQKASKQPKHLHHRHRPALPHLRHRPQPHQHHLLPFVYSKMVAVAPALYSQFNSSFSNEAQDDDVQPSTSSARCQYAPPPRTQRQVNASAQTSERYLSRSNAIISGSSAGVNSGNDVCLSAAALPSRSGNANNRRSENSQNHLLMNNFRMLNDHLDNNFTFNHQNTSWIDCDENNSESEEICTCHQSSLSDGSSHGGSMSDLNDVDELDNGVHTYAKDGGADLSYNIMHNLSISEDVAASSECVGTRKRKYTDSRLLEHDYNSAAITGSGGSSSGSGLESNSRKRVAYDFTSTPRSSQVNAASLVHGSTPSSQLLATTSSVGSPLGRRTPRSLIPTRDNPPPELQQWLLQFQRWSHAERLLAVDRLIEHCEPTQVRHMMKVIEPQFQRDFISLLPRELALQVLSYLDPKDLLRAAQTCRSWRFLCDDNLLWKEKCRQAQILTEPRTDRPKRGRAGNMPPIASPWKAAYMRQHIIEMNWRSQPIRQPKVLKGHDEHVITCLQFSGNRIVSGSDDNTLKVWSAVTGRCLRTLVGHTGGVWSSQMSGNIIISGSTDRTLKVWDMETGQCVHTLLGHTSTVRCMHLHGNKVVSGSRDATLRVWDIEQGTCLRVLIGHLAAVRCVQYDGKLIVSGAYDYMVKIWHPERSECLHTLQGHTNRVYSLQFDGIHVVSGSLDTSIRVWDVETGNCKHTLMGHQSLTSGMELRENILVSGNADSTVKVWDITTGQCLQTLSDSGGSGECCLAYKRK